MNAPSWQVRSLTRGPLLTGILMLVVGIGAARGDVALIDTYQNFQGNYGGSSSGLAAGQAIQLGATAVAIKSVVMWGTLPITPSESFSIDARNADGSLGGQLAVTTDLVFDSSSTLTTATFSSPVALQANTSYWLVLSATEGMQWAYQLSPGYDAALGITIPDTSSSLVVDSGSQTTYFNFADGPQMMTVFGNAIVGVPEPGPLLTGPLGGMVVLVLAWLRRRRSA